ncbi:hypothetical protein B0T17DRAFT_512241 [Bombardia bombarda]|uniref:CFEM domain-containing protein n=1 Tax=Bombardia bombarda TaxID=252184 RepID=A0AA39U1M9_9PEZI|nr:hypothetical protein B0T17DRAFT_512241 [Bombardia bombarda]
MHLQLLPLAAAILLASSQSQAQAQTTVPSVAISATTFSTATSSSSSSPTTTDTNSLPALISQLPTCAIKCFDETTTSIGCGPTQFSCLCQSDKTTSFALGMATCLSGGLGGNDNTDPACSLDSLASLAGNICAAVSSGPDQAQLAAATSIVSSALASAGVTGAGTTTAAAGASETGTGTETNKNDAAGGKNAGLGMGMLVVVAAYAVVAL